MGLDNRDIWNAVSEFSSAPELEDSFFDSLDELISEAGIKAVRLECEFGPRALIISVVSLAATIAQFDGEMFVEDTTANDTDAASEVVFISTIREANFVESVIRLLTDGTLEVNRLRWAGVLKSSEKNKVLLDYLQELGSTQPSRSFVLPDHSDSPVSFDLYRIPSAQDHMRQSLSSGSVEKIPEGSDNLRQRSEWFRRRTGLHE